MGWFELYERLFDRRLDIRPVASYIPSEYDYVFLLTDDDPRFTTPLSLQPGAKTLCFEHYAHRTRMLQAHRRIPLRKFVERITPTGDDEWMLPVWNAAASPRPAGPIRIVSIGNNVPSTPSELAPWFYDIHNKNVEFIFINRVPAPTKIDPSDWTDMPNVSVYLNISTEKMLECIAAADWLLFLPKNGNQFRNAISCMVPLSYSFRKPILLSAEWRDAYGLGGMTPLDPSVPLTLPSAACMEALEAERTALFARRDRILDAATA